METTVKNHRITVTYGMSGYFAIMVAEYYDEKLGWYTDVVNTGIGRYKDIGYAIKEGKEWAEDEGLPFIR